LMGLFIDTEASHTDKDKESTAIVVVLVFNL